MLKIISSAFETDAIRPINCWLALAEETRWKKKETDLSAVSAMRDLSFDFQSVSVSQRRTCCSKGRAATALCWSQAYFLGKCPQLGLVIAILRPKYKDRSPSSCCACSQVPLNAAKSAISPSALSPDGGVWRSQRLFSVAEWTGDYIVYLIGGCDNALRVYCDGRRGIRTEGHDVFSSGKETRECLLFALAVAR